MKDRSVVPYVALHFAVFLFGSAGVLSKMLVVSSLLLVFGRTLFATLSLIPLLLVQREFSFRAVPKTVILCGVLLAVHWLSFFAAMKAAPVAYGLMGFASLMTSLEPVYGIGVAYLVLHEMPGLRALIGCAIVISATVAVSYWHGKAH